MNRLVGAVVVGGSGSNTFRLEALPKIDPDLVVVEPMANLSADPRDLRGAATQALRRVLVAADSNHLDHAWGLAVHLNAGRVSLALQTPTRTVVRVGPGMDAEVRSLLDDHPAGPGVEEIRAEAAACRHPGLTDLLVGRRDRITFRLDGSGPPVAWTEDDRPGLSPLILPGSFRPFHAGHAAMAEAAERLVGRACRFDLSLFHPDKPPLDFLAIESRLRGFDRVVGRLSLTNAPTFLDKARLFPGSTFVVGHDTAERIIAPRYYGGVEARDVMLAELEALGVQLLIFGRIDPSGQFRAELDDPAVTDFLRRNTQVVPESVFRVDLSSTAIRDQTGTNPD